MPNNKTQNSKQGYSDHDIQLKRQIRKQKTQETIERQAKNNSLAGSPSMRDIAIRQMRSLHIKSTAQDQRCNGHETPASDRSTQKPMTTSARQIKNASPSQSTQSINSSTSSLLDDEVETISLEFGSFKQGHDETPTMNPTKSAQELKQKTQTIEALNVTVNIEKKKVASLDKKLAQSTSDSDTLRAQLQSERMKNKTLQQQLDQSEKEHVEKHASNDREIKLLRSENQRLKSQNRQLTILTNYNQHIISTFQSQKKALSKEVSNLSFCNMNHITNVNLLTSDNQQLRQRLYQLESFTSGLKQRADSLEKTNKNSTQTSKNRTDIITKEKKTLEENNNRLSKKIKKMETVQKEYQQKISLMKKELESVRQPSTEGQMGNTWQQTTPHQPHSEQQYHGLLFSVSCTGEEKNTHPTPPDSEFDQLVKTIIE